jgi:YD repeat-containing protein
LLTKCRLFINAVQAQRGKKITVEVADDLIAQAQAIILQLTPPTATPTATSLARLPEGVFAVSVKLPSFQIHSNASLPNYATTQLPNDTTTIDYTYDPLCRLTQANYSTGDFYHYAYDAVGNRLTQETFVSGLATTNTYTYDIANRLVCRWCRLHLGCQWQHFDTFGQCNAC